MFLIRTGTGKDPLRLAASAKSAIWSVDRGLPILGFSTLERVVSSSLAIRRTSLALVGGFAVIALLLSLIGIYGVLSYAVAQRVQEMGVRLALGARPVEITKLVVREGMRLALAGVLFGVVCGMLATRYASTLLFDIQPLDPTSFTAGVALVFAAAFLASYLPARLASRVDPMSALKYE